jgi:hypothetical protein
MYPEKSLLSTTEGSEKHEYRSPAALLTLSGIGRANGKIVEVYYHRERQEICAQRTFVGSAIGPKCPPHLPIGPQTFVVRYSILDDEGLDSPEATARAHEWLQRGHP